MEHYHVWIPSINRDGQTLTYYRGRGSFRTRSAANKARLRPKYQGSGSLPSMVLLCRDPHCRHLQDDEGDENPADTCL